MDVVRKILFVLLLAVTCLSCKRLEESRLQTKKETRRTAGIAVVYIGAANCRRYLAAQERSAAEIAQVIDRNKSFGRYITHLADGDNGELITVEFMKARHNFDLQFSGDRFLRKLTASTVSMAQIEGSCRRLLLRVDAAGVVPTLELLVGTTRQREQAKHMREDFGDDYGAVQCNGAFCTLSAVRHATRYFSYLLPTADQLVKVRVRWCPQQDCQTIHTETLTVTGIAP